MIAINEAMNLGSDTLTHLWKLRIHRGLRLHFTGFARIDAFLRFNSNQLNEGDFSIVLRIGPMKDDLIGSTFENNSAGSVPHSPDAPDNRVA